MRSLSGGEAVEKSRAQTGQFHEDREWGEETIMPAPSVDLSITSLIPEMLHTLFMLPMNSASLCSHTKPAPIHGDQIRYSTNQRPDLDNYGTGSSFPDENPPPYNTYDRNSQERNSFPPIAESPYNTDVSFSSPKICLPLTAILPWGSFQSVGTIFAPTKFNSFSMLKSSRILEFIATKIIADSADFATEISFRGW